ncbi:uncharacterized protein LOC113005294 [Solenopsis invicta]|uniref:uncharacterized protein LOC113005294 n=1 Tax=Solenopsis invicta TaxID=13686 RepID=UPI00193D907B|nr:uncharacterized protein LOC113005294 [Solenopsis invicta]
MISVMIPEEKSKLTKDSVFNIIWYFEESSAIYGVTDDGEKNVFEFEHFQTHTVNTSSSDVQKFILRKLLDIDFKISRIFHQQNIATTTLNDIQNQIKIFTLEDKSEKRISEVDYMEFFPLKTVEHLEKIAKLIMENKINCKALIIELSRIGGTDIKSLTFNILRRTLSDPVASLFSYVGGKKNVPSLICI